MTFCTVPWPVWVLRNWLCELATRAALALACESAVEAEESALAETSLEPLRAAPVVAWLAATREPTEVVVGEVFHHLAEPGVRPEEVLADVAAVLHRVALEFAVDRLVHPLQQHPVDVISEQLVPGRAPRIPPTALAAGRSFPFVLAR